MLVGEIQMNMIDETAVITGSTSGIGKKIAELFLKEGCKVTICSRNEKNVKQTVAEFQKEFGDSVIGFKCDVSQIEEMKKLIENSVNTYGSVRILVANAGLNLTYGPFELLPPEKMLTDAKKVIETNLIGMMNSVSAVLPYMILQRYGRIITLAGGGASRPMPYMTTYSASKGGVIAFSKCLAEEFKERKDDIKINIFQPGMIATNLNKTTELIEGWREVESYNQDQMLVFKYIGTDIEKSCRNVIPYALPTCRANGKMFRGYSLLKMIRGGLLYRKAQN